jgi:transcriptional regulator with XRE-family HTH domain
MNPRPKTKLRVIREQKGYSQEYMAEELGYQQMWFSRIERGELLTVGRERRIIAKLLGCKVSDLFTLKTKKPKQVQRVRDWGREGKQVRGKDKKGKRVRGKGKKGK